MQKIAVFLVAIVGIVGSASADQNTLTVTVNSDPVGATVYANNNKQQFFQPRRLVGRGKVSGRTQTGITSRTSAASVLLFWQRHNEFVERLTNTTRRRTAWHFCAA